MSVVDQDSRAFARASHAQYEWIVRGLQQLDPQREPDAILEWVQVAAGFAANHHPGCFADGRLENLALAIGRDLDRHLRRRAHEYSWTPPRLAPGPPRHVLHVATAIDAVGGDARTIANWIHNDPESRHSVVLLRQRALPIPSRVRDAAAENGGQLVVLPDAPPLVRAAWLRRLARSCDVVLSHQHPYDVVPLVAFAEQGGPPVGIVNHADHLFWLGSTVADTIVNLRAPGAAVSGERRFAKHNSLLPLPLRAATHGLSRLEARRRLGVPERQMMVLSIGATRKFVPTRRQDFYRAALALLARNPDAHLYLLGVAWTEGADYLRDARHDRLHFLGRIDDASIHQQAADVFVEGFPFPSPTALLETVLAGVPAVPRFAPPSPLLSATDLALADVLPNPHDQAEFVERATYLIEHERERCAIGAELSTRVFSYHVGTRWHIGLQELYARLDNAVHAPQAIPEGPFDSNDTDLALAEWHETKYRGRDAVACADDALQTALLDAAYWLRETGEARGAWRTLQQMRRRTPRVLVSMAKVPVHWAYRGARRAVGAAGAW